MSEKFVIVTIDYETWHIESCEDLRLFDSNYRIDWEKDLFTPTERLMEIAEKNGVKLSFMIEMCEYLFLKKNDVSTANRMKEQIKDIVNRGHDVQLHTHPHWLEETGASCVGGKYFWNALYANPNEYPFDLTEMISLCKNTLEEIVHEVDTQYTVMAYRSGSYMVQPFDRICKALLDNNIHFDTSVYAGGFSEKRGYDFRQCKSNHQPYKCSKHNPVLRDDASSIYELPIYTYRYGKRCMFDQGLPFAYRLILGHKCLEFEDNYYVVIGHTKTSQDYGTLDKQMKLLSKDKNITSVTLGCACKHLMIKENFERTRIRCISLFKYNGVIRIITLFKLFALRVRSLFERIIDLI